MLARARSYSQLALIFHILSDSNFSFSFFFKYLTKTKEKSFSKLFSGCAVIAVFGFYFDLARDMMTSTADDDDAGGGGGGGGQGKELSSHPLLLLRE